MTIVLPRLDRTSAERMLDQHRHESLATLSGQLPCLTVPVTYAAVGGTRVDHSTLAALRTNFLELATYHGMPGPIRDVSTFEGQAARLIRRALPMTPHEASHEDVWSYITCCWLLDVAVWRFGESASGDRFIGHVNRNTFRRMWWRDEVLGAAVDLTRLGEDEVVSIMERPTLYADARLARTIAQEFLNRVEQGGVADRMRLMREATKRLLRLTPFLAFTALADAQVHVVVADAFDAALAGLEGRPASMPQRSSELRPEASAGVEDVAILKTSEVRPAQSPSRGRQVMEFDEVARAAVEIARRTGRVTNTALREAAPITSEQARQIFEVLMGRNELARRGARRGTYYVIPEGRPDGQDGVTEHAATRDRPPTDIPGRQSEADSALRRLLRRTR